MEKIDEEKPDYVKKAEMMLAQARGFGDRLITTIPEFNPILIAERHLYLVREVDRLRERGVVFLKFLHENPDPVLAHAFTEIMSKRFAEIAAEERTLVAKMKFAFETLTRGTVNTVQ